MTVLIPAYEPTLNLLRLVKELQEKTNYRILIVDDGSGDSYRAIFDSAEENGCTILRHERNRGKGAALKTGFLYLLQDGNHDDVVCADSDGQHLVEDMIRVASAVKGNTTEMILGTREFCGSVPFKSRLGNKTTSLMMKLTTGLDLKDTQTGLRAYSYKLLKWINTVEGDRFEYELNLLLAAKKEEIPMNQITIATVYDNNNKGTHFRPFHDSVRVLAPILKFSGVSIVSGILDFSLLFLFQALSGSLFVSVVSARAISSIFNYTCNKFLVFDAKKLNHAQSAPKYFSLVAVIMLLNYALLLFQTSILGIPGVPAKLFAELTLFLLSYTVQKLFIFRKSGSGLNQRFNEKTGKQSDFGSQAMYSDLKK
jgi:glycosyltransferase involved in cell wall biosynthesis